MATRITRSPRGLLDFLGTQAQGDNPSELLDVVRPIVAIDKWLLVDSLEIVDDAVTVLAGNLLSHIQEVPTGQAWLLRFMSLQWLPTSTNDLAQLEMRMENTPGGSSIPGARISLAGDDGDRTSITANPQFLRYQFVDNTIVGTGTKLRYSMRGGSLALDTPFSCQLAFHRFTT